MTSLLLTTAVVASLCYEPENDVHAIQLEKHELGIEFVSARENEKKHCISVKASQLNAAKKIGS
ncbi:hypothetical protein [Pseudoalteromonas phenolica]|uniref:hypothetical protein n=1 Tax=Pseudoalteromonas phenolica TaxID=161398 RepID=UPI000FFEF2C8|nr:hypothetical protein [Pseudoalteromonas phenolica]RXE98456.1 hypothetical protein D9981_10310 [Pseudoalteromonas phenolica O-BC30]